MREVRLIDHEGKQLGIKAVSEALEIARSVNLDLVEVAPNSAPPVCKIMDFGKYKYELNKRTKESRKKQKTLTTKEIKMRPKIDDHDFDTKLNHAREFLTDGHKVKVYVTFRGREMAYQKFGRELLEKFAQLLSEVGTPEKSFMMEGRNMISIFNPKPVQEKQPEKAEKPAKPETPAAAPQAPTPAPTATA